MSEPEPLSVEQSLSGGATDTDLSGTTEANETGPKADAGGRADSNETSHALILIGPRAETQPPEGRPAPRPSVFVRSRFMIAAAAAVAVVLGVAIALINEHRQQAEFLAERAKETESLAQTVRTLKVRLDAMESASDLGDLRRSVGEMRSAVISSRELNGAVTQLSQRLDKLDHEEAARVDKVSERLDHEESQRAAELSARIERLEKRVEAPVSAAVSATPPVPPVQPKQPAKQPKVAPNVAMDVTGSVERPRPVLRGYVVLDARGDVAIVGSRYGEREVRPGEFLPGAGWVERIQRRQGSWVVLTSEGLIAAADPPY